MPLAPRRLGWVAFILFILSIPLANWLIGHVGTVCRLHQPCLIPVAPGLMAPSGVLTAGAALVLRDIVQRCLGKSFGVFAIIAGAAVSVLVAPQALVIASISAFMLSEFADFVIYTPLQQRGLIRAVLLSSAVGIIIDSTVFLWLAFDSLAFLPGQIVGKLWSILFSLPLILLTRRLTANPT